MSYLPNREFKVRFTAPFKDGNLYDQLVKAGFTPGTVPGTIKADSIAWVHQRLFEMTRNSGADLEVIDDRLLIPPSTRAEPEPEPEQEPEEGEELIPLSMDDLTMTKPARDLAEEFGISPAELVDSLPEWEVASGAWAEHKFSKAEVQALLD